MKLLLFLLSVISFLSCESNPYPQSIEEGKVERKPRRETMPPPVPIGMIVDGKYNYIEGVRREFQIKASVPPPGVPEITIEGLPAGASFDAENFIVSWQPGHFDGNDPKDPTIKSRDYSIDVYLRSSEDNIKAMYQKIFLTVMDAPQKFNIESENMAQFIEGKNGKFYIDIINDDYPKGPFVVNLDGWPSVKEIKKITENRFEISYAPNHDTVLLNKRNDCQNDYPRGACLKLNGKIIVYNPANHKTEKEVLIKIIDDRLNPNLVTPTIEEQGLDSSFQISSYDLNNEMAPIISLTSAAPEFGNFRTDLIKNDKNYSSVLNIVWNDIPPTLNGTKVKFTVNTCVLNQRGFYNNCMGQTIYRKIVITDRKSPIIDRSKWPIGKIEYLNFGQRKEVFMKVVDGDHNQITIQDVNIFPIEMRQFVYWKNGKLSLQFTKPGIHSFSVIAKSEYNISSAQSFMVDVFEKDRNRILYFTDSTRDEEVKFYKNIVKNIDLMNPVLQTLNDRNLSGRDTLILGTGILQDESLKEEIVKALKLIPNILIASPLIKNMPDMFLDELTENHHIAILGRYQDLGLSHELTELHFISRYDFEQGRDYVSLRGASTTQSYNPLIFSVGVDRIGCVDVLDLSDKKDDLRLKIGVICDRKHGGRFSLLGTEFSDIFTEKNDLDIPTKWLKRMLTSAIIPREIE